MSSSNKRTVDVAGFSDLTGDRLRLKRTRVEPSTTDRVDLTLPSTDGQLALTSELPDTSPFVTKGTPAQTITTVKTFTAAPVIATITNAAATLTLPTTTGTLALTSQLPDTSDFVTKGAPAQTITSVKTFTAAPVLSTITNGAATLTLPTTTGTVALISDVPTSADYVDVDTALQQAQGKHWTSDTQIDGNLTVTAGQFIGSANSAASPTYHIAPNTGLGMYSGAGNQLNFATGGVSRLQLLSSAFTITPRTQGPNGSNSGVSFGCGSGNEGIYFNTTTNTLNLADGSTATDVCRIAGTRAPQTTNPGLIVAVAGSSSAPSLRLSTDTAAGWYSSGSNAWSYGVSGVQTFTLSSGTLNVRSSQLTNALLDHSTTKFVDPSNTTKVIQFTTTSASSSTALTLASICTANRTITFPDAAVTLLGDSNAQTISATKSFTAQQNFDTGGVRIGSGGSVQSIITTGQASTSTVLTAGSNGTLATLDVTAAGFSAIPKVLCTISQPAAGANNWDRVLASIDISTSSATSVVITGVNTGGSSTSGTANINYWIWQ